MCNSPALCFSCTGSLVAAVVTRGKLAEAAERSEGPPVFFDSMSSAPEPGPVSSVGNPGSGGLS